MAPDGTGATNLTWPSAGGVLITNGWTSTGTTVWSQTFYVSAAERDTFGRTDREARRARSRAKAVPPVYIPGNAEDRVAPLAAAHMAPEHAELSPVWLTIRRGAPRERTCSRARHRRRTWERDDSARP